eukprot:COSAG01_NODE_2646_length_7319_cov_2.926316_2_plen_74_part_00
MWVYDSYGLSTSGGSYTTLGQLDQETPTTTRSGLEAIVSRAFIPSWNRSMLTEIYLCQACLYHEVEGGNARTG